MRNSRRILVGAPSANGGRHPIAKRISNAEVRCRCQVQATGHISVNDCVALEESHGAGNVAGGLAHHPVCDQFFGRSNGPPANAIVN